MLSPGRSTFFIWASRLPDATMPSVYYVKFDMLGWLSARRLLDCAAKACRT
jgi:hypothetical protein